MAEYEHERQISPKWSWAILILLCLAILGWGYLHFTLVKDPPQRQWDFGALPDAPGESRFSTTRPAAAAEGPRQIAPLPEATPWKGGKQ